MNERKVKIYLDASIPSAYYDERKPLRQKITQNWWNNIMLQEHRVYISEITLVKLRETKDPILRNKLLELVKPITVQELDFLVSWNFGHLVNPETRRKIKGVNLLKGYKEIDIVSPEELGGDIYE